MDRPDHAATGSGHVEETPEASPLTPPTMRDNYAAPLDSPSESAAAAGSDADASSSSSSADSWSAGAGSEGSGSTSGRAADVADRLKPVVTAAEEVAAKALDASAKGLGFLARKLEERRQHRNSGG